LLAGESHVTAATRWRKGRDHVRRDGLHTGLLLRREVSFGVELPEDAAHGLLSCCQRSLFARTALVQGFVGKGVR
jgi:hypothetical protein